MSNAPTKPKRVLSKENVSAIKAMPCSICQKNPPSDCHHWRSRGAGGGDELENLVALCHLHHVEFHAVGAMTFYQRYGKKIEASRIWRKLPKLKLKDWK